MKLCCITLFVLCSRVLFYYEL